MKNYLKKVQHILPIFLLAVFLCVFGLALFRYIFDYKLQILALSDKAWEIFLPMLLSVLSLIVIRKRFKILRHKDPSKDTFIYLVICAAVLCALLVNSQFYYNAKFSKNQTIENVDKISSDKNVKHIKIKSYYVDDSYLNYKFESDVSGKYGENLIVNFYFVAAILKDSLEEPKDDLPEVWFANKFSKKINNRESDDKKNAEYKAFREKCYQDLEHFNFYNNAYFLRLSTSEDKTVYDKLILNVVENPQNKKLIILSPSNGKFVDDGKSILAWFFKILGIGTFIILFALIFPKYVEKPSNAKEDDDFKFFINVFIPSKEFFITPILLDLNVLVFIILSLFGVNPFEPKTEELIRFGALTSAFFHGESWRIFSSMFMHAGIMHLVQNMVVLVILGFFCENIFGRKRFIIIYFLSGIVAGISSLLWHNGNLVAVGASGAIFGIMGAFAMSLILQNNFKETKLALLIIFAYFIVNIFFGLISNADNAAHIFGFISGMLFVLIFYIFKE
ncbi:rhomboid protease GluP [Halpernia humi]|uniref:Rhomboid protease GluP n=1 Tax=Halpernia humi TaxID=493375 RepID=A0A1H6BL32_9FLAO|nr:rhomboid family intramembrane serine protease [Halpernia humi]SEG61419.1 rhomboid protease GluP [Halpernia humi]